MGSSGNSVKQEYFEEVVNQTMFLLFFVPSAIYTHSPIGPRHKSGFKPNAPCLTIETNLTFIERLAGSYFK